MSQYQPPQQPHGAPGPLPGPPLPGPPLPGPPQPGPPQPVVPQGQPGAQFGQASQPQAPGQPGPYGQPGSFRQASQQPYGGPQAGGPQYGAPRYGAPASGGGLFDTNLRTLITPRLAKTANLAIIILAGVIALAGLLEAISILSSAAAFGGFGGSSATYVLGGIIALLRGPALAFVILTVGRLVVEFFLTQHRLAEGATKN